LSKVLVVDDDPFILAGLLAFFELESIDAVAATDCESAQALLASEYFPVVLADLRLRSEDEGLRLLESIRRISPRSRVASMTGYATPALEAQLQSLGARLVLHKPVGPDVVIDAVRALLAEIERATTTASATSDDDLAELYVATRRILFSIASRRYGFDSSDAEELLQEAWCLFLEKRQSVAAAKPWLAGTIVNLCRRERERRSRHVQHDETVAEPSFEPGDAKLIVADALEQLDPRGRDLIRMVALEDRSYEEVALHAGLPVGSIGPLVLRAKRKLRETLRPVTAPTANADATRVA
jgi:RNA polymerase sigma factor (sigma-70 family)